MLQQLHGYWLPWSHSKFLHRFSPDIFQTMLHRRKGGNRLLNIKNGYAQLIRPCRMQSWRGRIIVADDMEVFLQAAQAHADLPCRRCGTNVILTCRKINHFTWNMRILHDSCIIHIAQEPVILCTVLINARFCFHNRFTLGV